MLNTSRILIPLIAIFIISSLPIMSINAELPPLKQLKQGHHVDVVCADGFQLVLKQSNGSPKCIKLSSVEKLIQRGWAIHVLTYSDENNNSEIFTMGKYDVQTDTVNYSESNSGYLARPVSDESFPGVIMIHEWWGLNNNIKDMAKKLASHGYVVLAVDLYGGHVATTSEEARQLVTSFDKDNGVQNMDSAISYLDDNYSPESIGSIGWCFGGGQSLNLALNNPSLNATVIYYGSLVTDSDSLSVIHWPVLGIFAELDKGITTNTVHDFENSLNQLGIQNEIIIYPGVDHAFANPSGLNYAPEESQDAWQKTLEFLDSNLK
ncbi:dienelactone hydrolase family protein [Candidatus Nitrosarchaeum limnium]|jgi:carboxymethylenebutenolidase|uniref:dienelactone hydrolase family protein n=1 Tax=Candidatus Nitrosarchaeum limnium TaxID=1007084 RepID=UPI00026CE164|nr:dienelactone hydrolase family protein [Candidatus Nitrosarchaeum limnium]